jgi:hypothetical protein
VAHRLNHKDPALTLRRYAHPDSERSRDAGDKISKSLKF